MRVHVRTIDGSTLIGDEIIREEIIKDAGSKEKARDKFNAIMDVIEHVSELSNFNITVDSVKYHLNPKHIVWIAVFDPLEF